MRTIRNSAGMSLLSVLMGISLMSILALQQAGVFSAAHQQNRRIASSADVMVFKNTLDYLINKTGVCKASFENLKFDTEPLTLDDEVIGDDGSLEIILPETGEAFAKVGTLVASGTAISEMVLKDFKKIDALTYLSYLHIMVEGNTLKIETLPVILSVAVSGSTATITGCYHDEVPPQLITLYDPDTTTWVCEMINIQDVCGDFDGCKIRVTSQHEIEPANDITFEEYHIQMEQPSVDPTNGLFGTSRRGGTVFNWITGSTGRYTVLNTANTFYLHNYLNAKCPGVTVSGPAFTNPYELLMVNHPYVKTDIILID